MQDIQDKNTTEIEELKADIKRQREKMLFEYKVLTCIHSMCCVLLFCGILYMLIGYPAV